MRRFIKQIPINRITLRFTIGRIEDEFSRIYILQSLKIIRISLLLGCFLYAFFGALDIYLVPEVLNEIWLIRSIEIVFLAAAYFFTFRPLFSQYNQIYLSIITFLIALGIIVMVVIARDEGAIYYYAGLLLVIQFAHGLVRLRFIYATITTILICVTYLISVHLWTQMSALIILNNSYFLFSSVFVGMFISYFLEYFIRSLFWQKKLLLDQKDLLRKEHERKKNELETARKFQISTLPECIIDHPIYDICFGMKTAAEVGGDYFDYSIGEDGKINLLLGDATGHGVKAGLLVASFKSMFYSLDKDLALDDFFKKCDEILRNMKLGNHFMGIVYARLNGKNFEISAAGMPPILVYHSKDSSMEQINLKGLPLGSPRNIPLSVHIANFNQGDILLLHSDGLMELFNENMQMLGLESIKNILIDSAELKATEINKRILDAADNWRGNQEFRDDLTVCVIKVK